MALQDNAAEVNRDTSLISNTLEKLSIIYVANSYDFASMMYTIEQVLAIDAVPEGAAKYPTVAG